MKQWHYFQNIISNFKLSGFYELGALSVLFYTYSSVQFQAIFNHYISVILRTRSCNSMIVSLLVPATKQKSKACRKTVVLLFLLQTVWQSRYLAFCTRPIRLFRCHWRYAHFALHAVLVWWQQMVFKFWNDRPCSMRQGNKQYQQMPDNVLAELQKNKTEQQVADRNWWRSVQALMTPTSSSRAVSSCMSHAVIKV